MNRRELLGLAAGGVLVAQRRKMVPVVDLSVPFRLGPYLVQFLEEGGRTNIVLETDEGTQADHAIVRVFQYTSRTLETDQKPGKLLLHKIIELPVIAGAGTMGGPVPIPVSEIELIRIESYRTSEAELEIYAKRDAK